MKPLTRRQCLNKINEFDGLYAVLLAHGYREEAKAARVLADLYRRALEEMDGLGTTGAVLEEAKG